MINKYFKCTNHNNKIHKYFMDRNRLIRPLSGMHSKLDRPTEQVNTECSLPLHFVTVIIQKYLNALSSNSAVLHVFVNTMIESFGRFSRVSKTNCTRYPFLASRGVSI